MKLYYGAYGTIARAGNELSVSQRVRQENKYRELIPVGPSDMATEMQKIDEIKRSNRKKMVLIFLEFFHRFQLPMNI